MTQKELILSWGKGAVGTIEQTNDLTIGEVILTYRQLKALSITNPGTPNLKPNMATLLRVIRQRVQNNMGTLYYLATESGYPYQESSNYGMKAVDTTMHTIRLFTDEEDAQKAADVINRRTNTIGGQRGREEHDIVETALLGFEHGMDAATILERMGVDAISFGEHTDDRTDLNLRASTLIRHREDGEINFYTVAPKVYAMLGIIAQATDEKRPEEEIQQYRILACQYAATGKIGVAITEADYNSGECHPLTYTFDGQEYVEAFTDWAAMVDCLGEEENLYMAIGDWDHIMNFGKPVLLNREVVVDGETVHRLGIFTEKGRMALSYIAFCYQLDLETRDGAERCERILNDIRAAKLICQEFYSTLKLVDKKNEEGETVSVIDANFPDRGLVTVHNHTAKQFVDTGLCANTAAAYHVLALLYNDKDGSALKQFENAELYE